MLNFSKSILKKVSFDKLLFKKELKKSISWLNKKDLLVLKSWCLASFTKYNDIIKDTFDSVI
ncbi:MAG: hypothetical protein CMD04_02100 [Flavobacteriales bacterium]|nr:hypothetical protein [Flavobacteriales bacterium]|tara:strand:+ start:1330 stop:1515 length:186 start_codon:yes stop_codon:yes gene_type:complete